MARLLVLLLAFIGLVMALPLNSLSVDLSEPDTNVTTLSHSLAKRGCKYDFSKPGWVCDDEIPKLRELVQQLQDEPGGKAKDGIRAVFYRQVSFLFRRMNLR